MMKPSAQKRLTRLRKRVRGSIKVQENTAAMEKVLQELQRLNSNLGGGPRHKSAIPTTRP